MNTEYELNFMSLREVRLQTGNLDEKSQTPPLGGSAGWKFKENFCKKKTKQIFIFNSSEKIYLKWNMKIGEASLGK